MPDFNPSVSGGILLGDRLLYSRSRIQRIWRLALQQANTKADEYEEYVDDGDPYDERSEELIADARYASGVRDILEYLLTPDRMPEGIAELLGVTE